MVRFALNRSLESYSADRTPAPPPTTTVSASVSATSHQLRHIRDGCGAEFHSPVVVQGLEAVRTRVAVTEDAGEFVVRIREIVGIGPVRFGGGAVMLTDHGYRADPLGHGGGRVTVLRPFSVLPLPVVRLPSSVDRRSTVDGEQPRSPSFRPPLPVHR